MSTITYTAKKGVSPTGTEVLATLESGMAETLGAPVVELHTDANAANITNEVNATTGFTSVNLNGTGANVFSSTSGAGVSSIGTYAIHGESNDTPTNTARFYKDIATDFSLVNGVTYRISFSIRHVGTGGNWSASIATTNSGKNNAIFLASGLTSSDTTHTEYVLDLKYEGTLDYFVFFEDSAGSDGGVFVDALSVKRTNQTVSNPQFHTEQGSGLQWTLEIGWNISGGTASSDGTQTVTSLLYQATSSVVGDTYVITYTVSNYSAGTCRFRFGASSNVGISRSANGTYTETITFVAGTNFSINADSNFIGSIDNVSVYPAVPDSSINSDGLEIHGEITKDAVNTGSGLVSYSGYNSDNFLEQPYSSNLDFSTSDFGVSFLLKESPNTSIEIIFDRTDLATAQRFYSYVNAAGNLVFTVDDNTTVRTVTSSIVVDDSTLRHIHLFYDASLGGVYIYINSTLDASATGSVLLTLSNTNAILRIGLGVDGLLPLTNGFVSLFKIDTGYTATQIYTMYNNEKGLLSRYATYRAIGSSYTLTAKSTTKQLEPGSVGPVNISIGGSVEAIRHRDDDFLQVNTTEVLTTELPAWNEFIRDTDNQETFTYLPGAGYEPNETVSVSRDGRSSSSRRGVTDYHSINFKLKVR